MSLMANIAFYSIPKPQACSLPNPNSKQLSSIPSSLSPSTVRFTDVCGGNSRMCLQFKSRQAAGPDVIPSLERKKIIENVFLSYTVMAAAKPEPLKIMISGAPASGKGTQCELIKKKYQLVHIAAGDLLRAEVAAGSENGKRAKEFMEKGKLVPNEIVVMMVKERLLQKDAQENGWLLDGYPRSLSQAKALEDLNIHPDLFILLDVSEDILVERVVGRRLDPVTGKIYHLKYSPPENEEIAARLTQRFDDTEEKVKLRLQTHNQNVDAVLAVYKDVIYKVNGNAPKEAVFNEIDNALSSVLDKKLKSDSTSIAAGFAS